ncbi:MAG: metallophosphoesterase [Spirochaetes bacterium]|nr:metallophosphoesterase [Spirochaetota bacterium]
MESDIRLLFVSDLHLGIDEGASGVPHHARISTFRRIASLARDHDVFLVGGDLIDSSSVGRDVVDCIEREFRGLRDAGTEIVYAPGAGETGGLGAVAGFLSGLPLSRLFDDRGCEDPWRFTKEGGCLLVYGAQADSGFDIAAVERGPEEGYHLGLFHADIEYEEDARSSLVHHLRREGRREPELDFYAFAFSHRFRMFKILDRIVGVCPGSPEATERDETGDRYAVSIVIRDNRLYQLKRLTVNSMRLHHDRIDCSDLVTMGPIKDLLEGNRSKKAIQRLVLAGERNFVLRRNELKEYAGDFFRLDIDDRSVPTLDAMVEEFMDEGTLRGEFFRLLKERIAAGMPDDVDARDLALSLDRITRHGYADLEEWLCGL